jgi:hypothetical protein
MPAYRKKHIMKHPIAIPLTAILILSFIGILFLAPGNPGGSVSPPPANSKPQQVVASTSVRAVYAATGELASGFPAELILDANAKLSNSYSLDYNAALNQYTAVFTSDKSMTALFASYQAYFSKNGWAVTNAITKYPTSRGLYAQKGTSDASVAIFEGGSSREVTVSYLVR